MTNSLDIEAWSRGTMADESWCDQGRDLIVLAQVEHEAGREFEEIIRPHLHSAKEPKANALEKIISRDDDLARRCKQITDKADLAIVDREAYRKQVRSLFMPEPHDPTAIPPPLKRWLDSFVESEVDERLRCDTIPQRLAWEMSAGWGVPLGIAADAHSGFKLNLLTARQNAALCEVFDSRIETVCANMPQDRRFWGPGQLAAEVTLIVQQRDRMFDDGQSWTLPMLQCQRATLDTLARCLVGHPALKGVGEVTEHRSRDTIGIQLADLAANRGRKLYQRPNGVAELLDRPGRVNINGSPLVDCLQR